MDRENLFRIVNSYIIKMPSLPTSVVKILNICNDPKTSPADLNKVISLDPVLMGKVLKLINSAYYSLPNKINSLVRAIIMLGINTVKNLALSTAVLATIGSKSNFNTLNMEDFWRHSICVGSTAKLIAKRRKIDTKSLEEYFIAGLLHDIGKIPLNNRLGRYYEEVLQYTENGSIPLNMMEDKLLGANHAEVGKLIVMNWKLNKAIEDVVVFHHNINEYEGKEVDLLYTVVAANHFANAFKIGFSGNSQPAKVPPEVLSYLDIKWEYFEGIKEEIENEIAKAHIFLELSK
jgi:HD-like signal output (HDOD) protein